MNYNVLNYLDETVKKYPEKLAYADDELSLTFSMVDGISKSIGTFIGAKGMFKEPVIVYMKKSPRTIATFFGVVAAGCFYVPIDPEMPETRIRLILENCKPRLVICDSETINNTAKLGYEGEICIYDDISETEADARLLADVRERAIDTDIVYIVFTSGSTGVPKGVCACHRSIIDYIDQLTDVLGISDKTVFGNQTPLHVDACLKELYPTIKCGATTYLVPHKYFMFPVTLVEYLNEHKINTICWVASALTMISAFGTFDKVIPEYLTTVSVGSEVFPMKQFKLWREALPNAEFFNLYGPTEITGVCTWYKVDREFGMDEVLPIGRAFRNSEILLLDENGKPAADGEPGEICVRGTCVTLGYYNNKEKTEEAFVQNPLNTAYPELIYRTGDMAKKNERGELVFISRKDYQIKHMGHRIELGEIEANVAAVEGVRMCACVFDDVKNKILLYYVGEPDTKELLAKLKEKLPRYMVPTKIKKLDKLPLLMNGKIDRLSLKKQEVN